MTDRFDLAVSIRGWRRRWDVFWEEVVNSVPQLLERAANGRPSSAAASIRHDLACFAITAPELVRTELGVLAPTLDAAVSDERAQTGEDDRLGAYIVGLANVGNTFDCVGCPVAAETWSTIRDWLVRLEVTRDDERVSGFWTTGLIALALGDRGTYRRIAGHGGDGPVPFAAGQTFQMNLRGFIHHLAGAVEAGAGVGEVMPGFAETLSLYRRFEAGDALDEGSLLWMARIVHHSIGGQPVGTAAQFLHDTIWELAGES